MNLLPKFHKRDLAAAREHAAENGGIVIFSKPPWLGIPTPPDQPDETWGYWSDDADAFVRSWERIVTATDKE